MDSQAEYYDKFIPSMLKTYLGDCKDSDPLIAAAWLGWCEAKKDAASTSSGGTDAMKRWFRGWKEVPQRIKDDTSGNPYLLETLESPAGVVWYRIRGPQEAADVLRIHTEHHPDFTDDRQGVE